MGRFILIDLSIVYNPKGYIDPVDHSLLMTFLKFHVWCRGTMFLFNIIYFRLDIIFDLDRSLRLHSFLFGHIFRLYDFSRHLCVGLSYAHHYPVYIHSYLIMSHYRAHYSFAFNATIIPLAFTHAVRHDIIFDPFNFIIVEHNYSKFLFTLSCRLLVMTQN